MVRGAPDAPHSSKPSGDASRDRTKIGRRKRPPGQSRRAKNNSDIVGPTSRPDETASTVRGSVDDDPNARQFTVVSVGSGGTLYLKPSRVSPPNLVRAPESLRGSSNQEGQFSDKWPENRSSTRAGQSRATRQSMDAPISAPPISLDKAKYLGPSRSHSFSTVDEIPRRPTFDTAEFQLLVNGQSGEQRRRSSADIPRGLLDLKIPHYRIGSPRFSAMGTPYLRNSMYTSASEDMRSSIFSRAELDKLFPSPPGRGVRTARESRPPPSTRHLHPSRAASWSKSRLNPARTPVLEIHPGIYDRIAAYPHDASTVRYSPKSGQILAATPGRLVAQITSAVFLDYELLADFFITYRSFMSSQELLAYLLHRMKWALDADTDAGRIVRVRTFVALRHWILNYFIDDFVPDLTLRQDFCAYVNSLVDELLRQPNRGSTDISLLGELKKCWRRTCATVWPMLDALELAPDTDITPGEFPPQHGVKMFGTSAQVIAAPATTLMDFRRSSLIQLPVEASEENSPGTPVVKRVRTASIPASPMSEGSVEVLSCSVPFLNNLRCTVTHITREKKARPAGPQRRPPMNAKRKQIPQKGSFNPSETLEQERPDTRQHEAIKIRSTESMTFTGGLVRGLLLQPSPSSVEQLIPMSPPADAGDRHLVFVEPASSHDRQHNVKRVVGDVYRALSGRKAHSEHYAASHRSSRSSDSRTSDRIATNERNDNASLTNQQPSLPRVDVLGEKIEGSYREIFEGTTIPGDEASDTLPKSNNDDVRTITDHLLSLPEAEFKRLHSHLTTGSRSIVIVDDTRPLDEKTPDNTLDLDDFTFRQSAPDLSSSNALLPVGIGGEANTRPSPSVYSREEDHAVVFSDQSFGDFLTPPPQSQSRTLSGNLTASNDRANARKSSSAFPSDLDLPPIRHQLRRRPGGDLKAADHVHDLEGDPRPSNDTFSTVTHVQGEHSSPRLGDTPSSSPFGYHERSPRNGRNPDRQRSWSLLQTHSSQPNTSPSFQAKVSHLANLPERPHGGIQDALARLEGKVSAATNAPAADDVPRLDSAVSTPQNQWHQAGQLQPTNADRPMERNSPSNKDNTNNSSSTTRGRDVNHPSTNKPGLRLSHLRSKVTSPTAPSATQGRLPSSLTKSAELSKDSTLAADSAQSKDFKAMGVAKLGVRHKSSASNGSFLLDDNESLSDISTDIGEQSGDEGLGIRSFFFDDTVEPERRLRVPFLAPLTPPRTAESASKQSLGKSREAGDADRTHQHLLREANSAPKLPASPASPFGMPPSGQILRRVRTSPAGQPISHLPFILGFESDVIAEQMSIIEKDALDEVDWKDLVVLNWQQHPPKVLNWVDFLKRDDVNGIDLVIGRFNLVVKWVVSECVLTHSPTERARCITKYIHVAAHAQRLRNYATMYQITLGLLSADVARLAKTWALVANIDKQTLARLEHLCQPLRNFQHLRADMDGSGHAGDSAERACIPFIGLYTHDLVFNAQKPARIDPVTTSPSASPARGEALINFERCQTAAAIVKSLLRLVDASSRYIFRPHPEVLSRCLWLAALDDVELAARSRALEP